MPDAVNNAFDEMHKPQWVRNREYDHEKNINYDGPIDIKK